jgi:hypothetical protein
MGNPGASSRSRPPGTATKENNGPQSEQVANDLADASADVQGVRFGREEQAVVDVHSKLLHRTL